jgi:hypothetical protein
MVFDRCGSRKRGAALQYSCLGCWALSALLSGCALGLSDDFFISNSVAGGGTHTLATGGRSAVADAGGTAGSTSNTGGSLGSGETGNVGGSSVTGDHTAIGGAPEAGASSTSATGGNIAIGGATDVGGTSATGGNVATGGAEEGGTSATGGNLATGGDVGTGGARWQTGGARWQSGGTSTGGTSASSTYTPVCDSSVSKGSTCSSTSDSCNKICGPNGIGFKLESCVRVQYGNFVYDEPTSDCTFPAGPSYSCYAIPLSLPKACPVLSTPQATQSCTVADSCTVCYGGTTSAPTYLDSTGVVKTGYCVCSGGTWSCATSPGSWPCNSNSC